MRPPKSHFVLSLSRKFQTWSFEEINDLWWPSSVSRPITLCRTCEKTCIVRSNSVPVALMTMLRGSHVPCVTPRACDALGDVNPERRPWRSEVPALQAPEGQDGERGGGENDARGANICRGNIWCFVTATLGDSVCPRRYGSTVEYPSILEYFLWIPGEIPDYHLQWWKWLQM